VGWVYLLLAGVFEVVGTTVFRFIDGWAKPVPIVLFFVTGGCSLFLLYRSLESVPLGTAYAIWTGLGAAGTAVVGMIWFGEAVTLARVILLTTLIASIMGLKLVSP
jgi:quaternary ammonium compound-resistance protein SugE